MSKSTVCTVILILTMATLTACHNTRWKNQTTPAEEIAFQRLLQSADPEAMFQMGYFHFAKPGLVRYSNGKLVAEEDQNYGGALKWFRRSAEAGHVGAMIQTAHLLCEGKGVVHKDSVAAFYWYKRAFEKGERDYAPFSLGDYYMRGEGGVPQDYSIALHYYNQSYGSYPLEKLLARSEHSTEEIPKNTRFAIFGSEALRRISLFYRCGWGVNADVEKADRIVRQCAKYLGNPWCRRDAGRSPPPCILPSKGEKFDD